MAFAVLTKGGSAMDFVKTFAGVLRAMLYRLLKSRMTLVFMLVLIISIVYVIVGLKLIGANTSLSADVSATSSDITLGLSVLAAGASGVDFTRACGMLFVRGSFIAMAVAVFCGVFFASDLRTGAVKNVILGHTGRFAYALAAGVCTFAMTFFAVLAGVVVSLVTLVASGFIVAAPDPMQFVCWIGEVWLSVAAYAVLAVVVALLSKSTVLAAITGFLLGGAAVENLLYSAIGLVTGHPNEVRAIFDGYLAVTVSQLGYGNVLSVGTLLPALVTIVAAIAAGMLIARRRSLA